MKKIFSLLTILFCIANTTGAQVNNDCGGAVKQMQATAISCTGIRVQFTRPLEPKKFWSDPRVPEYEAYYAITYKPVLPQGYNTELLRSNDTSMKEHTFQLTANEQVSYWDIVDLLPGTPYEFCIYTRCNAVKVGPVCGTASTTNEAPCELVLTHTSKEGASFDFRYKKFTHIRSLQAILEYREQGGEWVKWECSSSQSGFLSYLKTNTTYQARLKFVYYNKLESPYTNEVTFTTGEK